jgi:hypothetical protein
MIHLHRQERSAIRYQRVPKKELTAKSVIGCACLRKLYNESILGANPNSKIGPNTHTINKLMSYSISLFSVGEIKGKMILEMIKKVLSSKRMKG